MDNGVNQSHIYSKVVVNKKVNRSVHKDDNFYTKNYIIKRRRPLRYET